LLRLGGSGRGSGEQFALGIGGEVERIVDELLACFFLGIGVDNALSTEYVGVHNHFRSNGNLARVLM